ncbi:MAG: glycoside hydrolase family 1 protein [Sandaracinaceae bacterium]|nr:glycoside hydrolase family 1 protein [Sandaracinaceae bacterium]
MGKAFYGALVMGSCLIACSSNEISLPDAGLPFDAGSDAGPPTPIHFGAFGPLAGEAGHGSFRFGVSTAATQIEDQNTRTDWYTWTRPAPDGLGHGVFVDNAVEGYSRAVDDVTLISSMHLDSYRFSMEWARIEPERDSIDEEALAHYSDELDALVSANIHPLVTIHHFSNPIWVDDPRVANDCPGGPTDENLCGFHHPTGAPLIIAEIAAHARLLATRFGDRVDDWGTLNEPINYLLASYGLEEFPPGRSLVLSDFDAFVDTLRNFIRAHVAIYRAIKDADTVDADGDGIAANVGLTLSVAEWVPARRNRVSDDPADIAAVERVRYVYHYLFLEALRQGGYDADLDGTPEEAHPEWYASIDWVGLQYYFRTGVSGAVPLIPRVNATVCFGTFDLGACLPPLDTTKVVPSMHYEFYEPGIYNLLKDFAERFPETPLVVSESGIATLVDERRQQHIVRSLEQIVRARDEGVDVRGYYHWSLTDNFEWAQGYGPRFGLYQVLLPNYERVATGSTTLLARIANTRVLSIQDRALHGGLGPMTAER